MVLQGGRYLHKNPMGTFLDAEKLVAARQAGMSFMVRYAVLQLVITFNLFVREFLPLGVFVCECSHKHRDLRSNELDQL